MIDKGQGFETSYYQTDSNGDLEVTVSENRVGYVSMRGKKIDGYDMMVLTPSEVRRLADMLAPYRTQPVANDLVAENKPRNDSPTFMAPRHGAYAGEE